VTVRAAVRAIEYHLPEATLTNEALAQLYPDWSASKIENKTGILQRHVSGPDETAGDLGILAARKLFASGACAPQDIDFILFCTQSPDYFLPTTACLMQDALGIPEHAGALDFNLGCSGFVYGLGLAQGLIETGQARNVLLVTAETYSKFIHPADKSVRTLFGDAAAATLVSAVESEQAMIGPFVYGTDGRGGRNLIVPTGGFRRAREPDAAGEQDSSGNMRTVNDLYMNGAEIFNFTLRVVPAAVDRLLAQVGLVPADVDQFVFHQANSYMLEHLRKKMHIPVERFIVSMSHCGNTVSSTIPIALRDAQESGALKRGQRVMLVGFGVGYSWGATLIRWDPASR
jgi:3-oxoacyl-[acyl-carrier-protein] synthase-3